MDQASSSYTEDHVSREWYDEHRNEMSTDNVMEDQQRSDFEGTSHYPSAMASDPGTTSPDS